MEINITECVHNLTIDVKNDDYEKSEDEDGDINMDTDRKKIIQIFCENVKGKKAPSSQNTHHSGSEGHWLERQMGLKVNGKNMPDILGYEMKKDSKKTTFGDWGPDYKLFTDIILDKKTFFHMFGKPNKKKNNRLSYTRPKFNCVLDGKKMIETEFDVRVIYDYELDTREDKAEKIGEIYRNRIIILEKWSKQKLQTCLENKFKQKGWFVCLKNEEGIYTDLKFYGPIRIEIFLKLLRQQIIYQDGVPYQNNYRWYSQWRINKNYINKLYESE